MTENNKRIVAITSISEPTEAIRAIAAMSDRRLAVAGDNATPESWRCEGADYLSPQMQAERWPAFAALVPENCYPRKMFAYLHAMELGAEVIIDTDDDNIPVGDWLFPDFQGRYAAVGGEAGFVNIYQLFSEQKIWPRGLPPNLIRRDFKLRERLLEPADCNVGIWQGLADEDPDVDAIYRLSDGRFCYFNDHPPVALERGVLSPFNSQNTATAKSLFALLYLPVTVTFRFTDILRSLVAQPIMWLCGQQLGFTKATMIQKRNAHDLTDDLEQEMKMYRYAERIVEWIDPVLRSDKDIAFNMRNAYEELARREVVAAGELKTLSAWLEQWATTT